MAEELKGPTVAENLKGEAITGDLKGGVTPDSSLTVRSVFELPEKGVADPSDDRWQAFQDQVSKEVKGVKWTAAMPDLASKVCELLDIKIPNILMAAWKKAKELQTALEESKKKPEEVTYLGLAEHSINSEHKPSIDMKLKNILVKRIELKVALFFKLKGFVVKIQDGRIREIQTGHCEFKGTIKYQELSIAEKKLEPIKLPFTIPIHSNENGAEKAAEKPAEVAIHKTPEVERIEI